MSGPPCQCTGCGLPHLANACPLEAAWYVDVHPVDMCQQVEFKRGYVCVECFKNVVDYCNRIVLWAISEFRPAACDGCGAPVERLSDVIKDVVKL